MQFHHPHAFRAQVAEALQAELPEVWHDLLAAGAEPVMVPTGPGGPAQLMAVRCRRLTFERVLRSAAARQPGLILRTGQVDEVCAERGRATGVRVDGVTLDADLVIAASGRGASAVSCARRRRAVTAASPTSRASTGFTPAPSPGR